METNQSGFPVILDKTGKYKLNQLQKPDTAEYIGILLIGEGSISDIIKDIRLNRCSICSSCQGVENQERGYLENNCPVFVCRHRIHQPSACVHG